MGTEKKEVPSEINRCAVDAVSSPFFVDGGHSMTSRPPWSYTIAAAVHFQKLRGQVMGYWRDKFAETDGGRGKDLFMTIGADDLASNPAGHVALLLDYCGLGWNEGSLLRATHLAPMVAREAKQRWDLLSDYVSVKLE